MKVLLTRKTLIRHSIKILISAILCIIIYAFSIYAKNTLTDEYVNNVCIVAGIVDDIDNLDMQVKRIDFAKMVVHASPYKDLDEDFVKTATENKYMIRNIYGDFRGEEYVSYNDLIRACTELLGYSDKDFIGNKVNARAEKFVELELHRGIEKNVLMPITKQDILNGIYNTLKEQKNNSKKKLYEEVFNDMTIKEDGELSISDMANKTLDGPYIVNRNEKYDLPFDVEDDTVAYYINGRKLTKNDFKDDVDNYGYAVVYYDKYTNTVYEYSERTDAGCTVACKKCFIEKINYNAKDMTTPYTVDVDIYRYRIASDEMLFAFSHVGHIKVGDKVILVYNKINDLIKLREEMKEGKDEGRIINGSIITAIKVE